jgi:hypothetical protein
MSNDEPKMQWVIADYPTGFVRGVYPTRTDAESGLSEILRYDPDLTRDDFTVQLERVQEKRRG